MARGTTLGQLLQKLRFELKLSASTAMGQNTREQHIHAIVTSQERLAGIFAWPFLRVHRDIELSAGQRYYDFPEDLSLEDALRAEINYNGTYSKVEYGITSAHYNQSNSDNDSRLDPVTNWQLYRPDDDGDQLEVWPMPATDDVQTLRLHGVKTLNPLVSDSDTADLDDLLIVYTAALDFAKDDLLKIISAKQQSRFQSLTGRLEKNKVFVMGGGLASSLPPRRTIIVTRATDED